MKNKKTISDLIFIVFLIIYIFIIKLLQNINLNLYI